MTVGILLDLDGTLLDTLEDLTDAVNDALGQFGLPGRTVLEVRDRVGNGALRLMALALPGDTASPSPEELLSVFKPYYDAHCRLKTRPYDGIPEALAALKGKYPIAVVSNKPDSAVKSLCADFFPGIYALGEAPDCPRKPAADMVQKAMAAIGADQCIYVGDSEVDVATAKNAGVPGLIVLWGFRNREELEAVGAEHFCEKTEDLVAAVERLVMNAVGAE